jgi:hypothetical protein
VLQKALAFAKEPYFSVFITSIKPFMDKLRTLNFGAKLYSKLLSLYPDLGNGPMNVGEKRSKKKEPISKHSGRSVGGMGNNQQFNNMNNMGTGYNKGKLQNNMQYKNDQF